MHLPKPLLKEMDAFTVANVAIVSNQQKCLVALCRLETELAALEEQRYVRFAVAVQETNGHLSAVFRRLSGQRGDAYCSHAEDARLAFAQGLQFHVRCAHTWARLARWLPCLAWHPCAPAARRGASNPLVVELQWQRSRPSGTVATHLCTAPPPDPAGSEGGRLHNSGSHCPRMPIAAIITSPCWLDKFAHL